jgi:capsular polysaccharide biosynthesis protein
MTTQRRKEILRNFSAFGGYGYRVMYAENTQVVTIQRRYNNGRWQDTRTVDLYEYEQWFDATAHDRSNPALLARLAGD